MNIGQLDGQPLALQIFNGMTAESICVNERRAKDQLFRCVSFAGEQIKSTPSIAWRTLCFNLRPPCGGRLGGKDSGWRKDANFNPRPPCGGRRTLSQIYAHSMVFQSTSSVWRTTQKAAAIMDLADISIHVLRVEDDDCSPIFHHLTTYFNPRPPCGGRQLSLEDFAKAAGFQSTSSVWRTTLGLCAL